MRRLLLASALLLGLAAPALFAASATAAQDEWSAPPPAWEGVWQGSVGALPIHLCLDNTPSQTKGAYYYDRVKKLLRLVPGDAEGQWFEQESDERNGASWRLAMQGRDLVGTWRLGSRQMKVRLKRIGGPSKDFDGPCGSIQFHRPRIAAPRLTAKPGRVDGTPYKGWTFKPGPWLEGVEISTFTLDSASPGAVRVNALLRAALPKADGSGEWLECVAASVNASSLDGSYYKAIAPVVANQSWLGARESGDYDCGGAHPENVNLPRTFDLAAGVEVDPLDWFGAKAVRRENVGEGRILKSLTPAFVAAMLRGWKNEESECDQAMREQKYWSAGIERGSLVFSPQFPRVILSCSEDIKIPFARLQPWLNEKGKAAVATLP